MPNDQRHTAEPSAPPREGRPPAAATRSVGRSRFGVSIGLMLGVCMAFGPAATAAAATEQIFPIPDSDINLNEGAPWIVTAGGGQVWLVAHTEPAHLRLLTPTGPSSTVVTATGVTTAATGVGSGPGEAVSFVQPKGSTEPGVDEVVRIPLDGSPPASCTLPTGSRYSPPVDDGAGHIWLARQPDPTAGIAAELVEVAFPCTVQEFTSGLPPDASLSITRLGNGLVASTSTGTAYYVPFGGSASPLPDIASQHGTAGPDGRLWILSSGIQSPAITAPTLYRVGADGTIISAPVTSTLTGGAMLSGTVLFAGSRAFALDMGSIAELRSDGVAAHDWQACPWTIGQGIGQVYPVAADPAGGLWGIGVGTGCNNELVRLVPTTDPPSATPPTATPLSKIEPLPGLPIYEYELQGPITTYGEPILKAGLSVEVPHTLSATLEDTSTPIFGGQPTFTHPYDNPNLTFVKKYKIDCDPDPTSADAIQFSTSVETLSGAHTTPTMQLHVPACPIRPPTCEPSVNSRNGQIIFSCEFQTYGALKATARAHEHSRAITARTKRPRKCHRAAKRHRRCARTRTMPYGSATLNATETPGAWYTMTLKPGKQALKALKKNRTLLVTTTFNFHPAHTTRHLITTATVTVRLDQKRTKK